MPSRSASRTRRWAKATLAGLLLICSAGGAQTPEAGLKAAYTLNFAKFTHWPKSAFGSSGKTLRVCVVGRSSVGKYLEESKGELVGGRRLEVDYVRLPGDVSGCKLLFLSELDLSRGRRLLASLGQLPILTLSDVPGFAEVGGIVELMVRDKRLRFAINLDSARRAGLRLDPKLLRLAVRLHGDPGAIPK